MRSPFIILGVALLAAAMANCEDETSLAPNGSVSINGQNFDPATVALTGTNRTVTWGFFSGGPHNVTFQDGVNSGNRSSGVWSRNFSTDTTGLYRYRCTIHSTDFMNGMIGQVIVP